MLSRLEAGPDDDVFFFKQKTAYEMRISDWSSDVCSSDILFAETAAKRLGRGHRAVVIPARQPHPGGDAIGHMRRQPDASADIDPVIAIASGIEQRKSTRIGIGVNVERPADRKSTRLNSSN